MHNLRAQRDPRVSWTFTKVGQKFVYVDLRALETYLTAVGHASRLGAIADRVSAVRLKGNFFSPNKKWD